MLVKDLMTKDVITSLPQTLIGEVAQWIYKERIHGIPVVENSTPIGIITETDFFSDGSLPIYLPSYINFLKNSNVKEMPEEINEKVATLLKTQAKDIMSTPCVTINQNAQISEFVNLVKEKNFSTVPVVDDSGNLAGIITLADIIKLINLP